MAAARLLLVNAMLGQFITGFAARSFVIGIPTIATALDADIVGIAWAIVAYQLAGISLSVVFGRLGDIHGRHLIYGAGFAIMAASALGCGLAPSVAWLVGFRLLAGVGGAMLASATRVLALEALPDHAAGKAHGLMTVSFHGGVLLGPPIGGMVIDLVSWRRSASPASSSRHSRRGGASGRSPRRGRPSIMWGRPCSSSSRSCSRCSSIGGAPPPSEPAAPASWRPSGRPPSWASSSTSDARAIPS
jgi:hypothetical protein